MEKKRLKTTLIQLYNKVAESNLTAGEKNSLRAAIKKLFDYVGKHNEEEDMIRFTTEITDYIVAINDAIQCKRLLVEERKDPYSNKTETISKPIDVIALANDIVKEVGKEEKRGFFKKKMGFFKRKK